MPLPGAPKTPNLAHEGGSKERSRYDDKEDRRPLVEIDGTPLGLCGSETEPESEGVRLLLERRVNIS